jgi:hypothetical protein
MGMRIAGCRERDARHDSTQSTQGESPQSKPVVKALGAFTAEP